MAAIDLSERRDQIRLFRKTRNEPLRAHPDAPAWPATPFGIRDAVRALRTIDAHPLPGGFEHLTLLDGAGCEVAYRYVARKGRTDRFVVRGPTLDEIGHLVGADELAWLRAHDTLDRMEGDEA